MKTTNANRPVPAGQVPGPPTRPRLDPSAPAFVFNEDLINILIVDDRPENLAVLETVLDDPVYRLVRAESADQALLALVVEEFALLILDIRMPGMTGIELAQMIKGRKKTAQVPIIFLTAHYTEDENVLAGYGTGAVDYLHKPVNATVLRSKVAVFAELHRTHLALLEEVRRRRYAEAELRALTQRVVQLQETERGGVALRLHDHVTQLVCAAQIRSQVLLEKLTACDGGPKRDAVELRTMLGQVVAEVERVSQSLRPSILEHLGLSAALRASGTEFAKRTGVAVVLDVVELSERLPIDSEMALFRIIQEALKNVERHARARHLTVGLSQQGELVQLTIKDDGVGIGPATQPARREGTGGLGLLGMRERATQVGGTLKLKSTSGVGTEIEVSVPRSAGVPAVT